MIATSVLRFEHAPSPLRYMLTACLPRTGRGPAGSVPRLHASWSQATVPPRVLADFVQLTGLRAEASLPILWLQTWGFRLQLAVLTQRAFPLALWGALQVRSHLLQHRPLGLREAFDLDTRVVADRALDKGLEVDLHTTARVGTELAWEGLTTYFYRGRLLGTDAPSPLARGPAEAGAEFARWHSGSGSGWRFGRLTGDFNPLHWSDRYARRAGLRCAFHHPQRVLGQGLAHLGQGLHAPAQRLDAWLKGPVYYGSTLALQRTARAGAIEFGLRPVDEARAAIVGRWSIAARGERLFDADGAMLPPPCR